MSRFSIVFLSVMLAWIPASAQQPPSASPLRPAQLDPARSLAPEALESSTHQPLPEQYIWTAQDAVPAHPNLAGGSEHEKTQDLGPHYFRRRFQVATLPAQSTLYVAGPRSATIYLNDKVVQQVQLNLDSPLGIRVFACDVTHALRQGENVLAIEAVRGPDIASGADSRESVQQTEGRVLAVKLLPAAQGVIAAPLLISDAQWKASMQSAPGWQTTAFDDTQWPKADSLGGIESSIEFFQWNADAGLYDWPGYEGISPFLAQYELPPTTVSGVYAGLGHLEHADALTKNTASSPDEFTVHLPSGYLPAASAPQIVLDFGREVVGRLELANDADEAAEVTLQYGESEAEMQLNPYLGVDPLHVPPHATAYGPKSAFRYALVRFLRGSDLRFKSIRLAGIAYLVTYKGSFESSDAKLNQMWAVGAYTAHLCMQDDIWDAPKRDRGRWMGDLDVSGRTIEDSFDDHFLMEETLNRLLGEAPVRSHVNGIAGYSAFWVTGEAEYYRHTGSQQQLASVHDRLVQLMHFMETELDARNLYANNTHSWPFVDWSPELNGDDPESRRATQFEFYDAFHQGTYLLRELGDTQNAELFERKAEALKAAAQKYLLDPSGSFGTRWQTNAYAVLSGAAEPTQYDAIWRNSLASVGHVRYNGLIVTPYYNYYVISAMAQMGHRREALDWIRQYWGGMIDEGATSFWEGYDPDWYKDNFHASLQADNMSGYRVSLAHGWSSGVTPWLMEQVLGIHSRAAGFREVDIRPDLIDLAWARGAEPTPRGLLGVSLTKSATLETAIDLPPGTEAHVSVPVAQAAHVLVDGKQAASTPAENGTRAVVTISAPGHHALKAE